MGRKLLLIVFAIFLGACTTDGPRDTLDEMARALDTNNPALFMSQMDMTAFAKNYVADSARNDVTLNTINRLGAFLGLGSIDDLLNSILDMKNVLTEELEQGVASGELAARCGRAATPDCPWVARSLREAEVVIIARDAAIAKVTTPTRLTSWLSLSRINGRWQVVGNAVMEHRAREMALASAPAQPAAPGTKTEI